MPRETRRKICPYLVLMLLGLEKIFRPIEIPKIMEGGVWGFWATSDVSPYIFIQYDLFRKAKYDPNKKTIAPCYHHFGFDVRDDLSGFVHTYHVATKKMGKKTNGVPLIFDKTPKEVLLGINYVRSGGLDGDPRYTAYVGNFFDFRREGSANEETNLRYMPISCSVSKSETKREYCRTCRRKTTKMEEKTGVFFCDEACQRRYYKQKKIV
jgi:hypothetical protein